MHFLSLTAALCLLVAATPLPGDSFKDWKRAAARGKSAEERIAALEQIDAASADVATPSEVVRALAPALKDDANSVRVRAAQLLGEVEDQDAALSKLKSALKSGRTKFLKAQKALRATEDKRSRTIDLWWEIQNDPNHDAIEESGAYLQIRAAEVALFEAYLGAERSRRQEEAFCHAVCESLSELDRVAAAAHSAIERFYERVASASVDRCPTFAPVVLSLGTKTGRELVIESLAENESALRSFRIRRERMDAYEKRRDLNSPSEPSPFEETEAENHLWGERIYQALTDDARSRGLAPLPEWNPKNWPRYLEKWRSVVEEAEAAEAESRNEARRSSQRSQRSQ